MNRKCCTYGSALVIAALLFLFLDTVHAQSVTFHREYRYQASEVDSKVSCRAIALEQAKRLLLEELGTYLESETEVRNYQLTKDQITTLTAGIVRTEIVAEKWDGNEYWLKARIVADPDQVVEAIDNLRNNRQKTRELEEARAKAKQALSEVEKLRRELALARTGGNTKTKLKEQYNEAIKELSATDWLEKGHAYDSTNLYEDRINALKAYSMAIKLSPRSVAPCLARGAIYGKQGQYARAIADFRRCLEIDPDIAEAHYNLGTIYIWQGQYDKAIYELTSCLRINPSIRSAYHNRGVAYKKMGREYSAAADFQRAKDPKLEMFYTRRGNAYAKKGQHEMAIEEYSNALTINPRYGLAYYNRGVTYWNLRDKQKATEDIRAAAKLGNMNAKDFLKSRGIGW